MTFTLVSFHAHPDDETLLTGGTLARASADGHRVILVCATDGGQGLASAAARRAGDGLASIRRRELDAAADRLGITKVIHLGYGDTGSAGTAPPATATREPFAVADGKRAALRLADILRREHADALTIYDSAGGYGHRDHVQVHNVGVMAGAMAGTRLVLEATVDRDRLRRALRLIAWLPGLPRGFRADMSDRYCDPNDLTHRIDVRGHLDAKRAAMAAHASQATADSESRTLGFCLRMPGWLFARAFGYEWFRELGRVPSRPLIDDLFASLR